MVEFLGGAEQPARERRPQSGIAFPEAAHLVAETIVPLGKAGRMVAELIAAGTKEIGRASCRERV